MKLKEKKKKTIAKVCSMWNGKKENIIWEFMLDACCKEREYCY
jgi:hypothetical protein